MVVSPIKSLVVLQRIKALLSEKDSTGRNVLLFNFGINTNLRISEIIILRYSDIFTAGNQFREHLRITPLKKRGKKTKKTIKLNKKLKEQIQKFCLSNHISGEDFIFFSFRNKKKNLQRQQAWRILKDTAEIAGFTGNMGSHSMRKTFGYHFFQSATNSKEQRSRLAMLQILFSHASQEVTLRYIGIEQQEIDAAYDQIGEIFQI